MAFHFEMGAEALQASYRVRDAGSSALTSLRALAFALVHDLRGRGKSRLGLSTGLWGNGMALSRRLLKAVPWQGFSAVEDAEQHLHLLLYGVKVKFVSESHVYGYMPTTFKASRDQQRRWEGGKIFLARRYSRPLLLWTLKERSFVAACALLELLLPPLSVHLCVAMAAIPIFWLVGGSLQTELGIASFFALGVYVLSGLLMARLPFRVYGSLFYAPVYIGWKAWLFILQLPRRTAPPWMKTTRNA
jgi:cellulose synthase/poly-beta-1,6-N-acetylglucosamine synthase-like glycosyltransferase